MAQTKRRPMPREVKDALCFQTHEPVKITTDLPLNRTWFRRGIGWSVGRQIHHSFKGATALYISEFSGPQLDTEFAVVLVEINLNDTAEVVIHRNFLTRI